MIKDKQFYVYKHIYPPDHHSKPNQVFYVGKGHGQRAWSKNRGQNKELKNTLLKYGFLDKDENGKIEVELILCESEKEALQLEVKIIKELKLSGIKLFNKTDGGEGASGYVPTPETIEKLRISHLGKVQSDESNAKRSKKLKGSKKPDGYWEKWSEKRKGHPVTEETKEKIRNTIKTSKAFKDALKCPLRSEAIRRAHTGKIVSLETREKLKIVSTRSAAKRRMKKLIETYLSQDTEYRPRGPYANLA